MGEKIGFNWGKKCWIYLFLIKVNAVDSERMAVVVVKGRGKMYSCN